MRLHVGNQCVDHHVDTHALGLGDVGDRLAGLQLGAQFFGGDTNGLCRGVEFGSATTTIAVGADSCTAIGGGLCGVSVGSLRRNR